jgi:hypothetical protein
MRLPRLLAIAERDLRIELTGRAGLALPGIAATILLPIALAPPVPERPLEQGKILVGGDVPAEVLALDRVARDDEHAILRFIAPTPPASGPFIVRGDYVPESVRGVMDALYPGVRTELVEQQIYTTPKRSLLLALVAASVLTGSLAQSLAGERSQRTLDTLLAASVTRAEIIVGKWLAWSGFGALSCLLSVALALGFGRQDAGWWILPAPTVSLGTAALGLWLVRHADDVVGGASTTIRVLPAAVSLAGLAAWMLGRIDPLLGAAIPLGGALMAAGDAWPGLAPPVVASVSTVAMSAGLLAATARDLDPDAAPPDHRPALITMTVGLAAGAWWMTVAGPLMWAMGGNPSLTEELPVRFGVAAGGLATWLLVVVRMSRDPDPFAAVGLARPRWPGLLAAALAAPALARLTAAGPEGWTWGAQAGRRMHDALTGASGWEAALAAAVAQELLLRGWLRRTGGDVVQVLASVLILSPLDPTSGLLVALASTLCVRLGGGSVLPAVVLRAAHLALVSGTG